MFQCKWMDHTCNGILWIKTDLRIYRIEKLSCFPQNNTCFEKKMNAIINSEHFVSTFVLQVPCDDEKSWLFKKIHVEIFTSNMCIWKASCCYPYCILHGLRSYNNIWKSAITQLPQSFSSLQHCKIKTLGW